ncbi:MAG: FtsX-like permease family protein, partial [Gemmatimonadetes bacterium]|nr:FtsX-like permease family protein [Gemmatimonadota bacterium]NIR79486.1 FtsX-like permease family protein [Gemmatimonadota bacterium]NIT88156.1 FtsX-like permease family protein [Gemmatimonadota bacterium]NIU31969.1 FtsX-like permease family protein [Gemmatimonadota bacterium]NIU36589.1 FtsX-like permease family protein [Gemmatimonadota bacterium]
DLLGVRPALGRTFAPAEEEVGASSVVVLSHALWVDRFGADPGIVGERVELDARSAQVVGVMPEGFIFPTAEIAAWLPLGLDRANPPSRGSHYLRGVARLAPGVGLEEARAELETITASWNEEFEHHAMGHFLVLEDLRKALVGETAGILWLLLGAVGLVLVMACANVANLMLARTESREREVSVRAALGAGRGRLLRQFVTESLVLAALGAALGLLLAHWGTDALVALDPDAIPRSEVVALDGRVLLYAGGLALGTALLFGLAPALHVGLGALASRLRAEHGSTAGSSRARLRRGLVMVEAAVCAVVLVAAGLVGRSLWELVRVDPGVRTEGVLTFELALPASAYGIPEQLNGFYERLQERIEGLPGVAGAATVNSLPLTGDPPRNDFYVGGEPRPDPGVPAWNADLLTVSHDYFETMGIPVIRGRGFEASDGTDGPYVAVIDEAAARKYWPGGDALDRRVHFNFTESQGRPSAELVGIVRSTKAASLDEEPRPQLYLLNPQTEPVWGGTWRTRSVVV